MYSDVEESNVLLSCYSRMGHFEKSLRCWHNPRLLFCLSYQIEKREMLPAMVIPHLVYHAWSVGFMELLLVWNPFSLVPSDDSSFIPTPPIHTHILILYYSSKDGRPRRGAFEIYPSERLPPLPTACQGYSPSGGSGSGGVLSSFQQPKPHLNQINIPATELVLTQAYLETCSPDNRFEVTGRTALEVIELLSRIHVVPGGGMMRETQELLCLELFHLIKNSIALHPKNLTFDLRPPLIRPSYTECSWREGNISGSAGQP